MTVLVVAAHPDDEVLGAGATMARLAREGRAVETLILGEGVTSRLARRTDADPNALHALVDASVEAAERLGTSPPTHAGLPDNRFDQLDLLDVVKIVEERVAAVQPSLVLTHHAGDLNVDHQVTARATLVATRPQPAHPVRTVMSFEVVSATEWAFTTVAPPFNPSVFVDVTDTLAVKLHALEAYGEELRDFPHPRSLEGVTAQATRWGTVVGVRAAEAFHLVRSIR